MESLFRYVAPPSSCGYLPDRLWSLEYEMVAIISADEYMQRMNEGWRRFGGMLFRPQCPACRLCQSLRVEAAQYRPSRSQRRVMKANQGELKLRIAAPSVSHAKLQLYDRYHAFQSDSKGWPVHPAKDAASYRDSFVNNPSFTEEWRYYLGDRLVGVGYVDDLPQGLSAIYFYYEPDERRRSPGIWNVISILSEAVRRGKPYAFLGYFVASCPSLAYKADFRPCQILQPDRRWLDHPSPRVRE